MFRVCACCSRADGSHAKQLHLFAALIEGSCLADQRVHTPRTGRELRMFEVQFGVGGKLSGLAVRTKIVRACDFGPAHSGEDRSGPQFAVASLLAAAASDAALIGRRLGEAQQCPSAAAPA